MRAIVRDGAMELVAFVIAMVFFGLLLWEVAHPEKF